MKIYLTQYNTIIHPFSFGIIFFMYQKDFQLDNIISYFLSSSAKRQLNYFPQKC